MIDLQYSTAIDYLLERLPSIQQYHSRRSIELYADKNPHVVFGSILVEYLNTVAFELARTSPDDASSILHLAFRIIEDLSVSNDFELRCLVETSILEGLLGEKGGLEAFAPYMIHETKQMARSIAQNWGLNAELLS